MTDGLRLTCKACHHTSEFESDDDVDDCFYYCQRCCAKVEGFIYTASDNDGMHFTQETSRGYAKRHVVPIVKTESQTLSQFWQNLQTQEDNAEAADDHGPADFPVESGTLCHEDYYSEIRMRYVMGVQIMLQLQIKALVDKFNVSPVILDLVEPIWSKFVASTEVFADHRATKVIRESKSKLVNRRTDHISGKTKGVGPTDKHEAEPPRCMIWYRYVSKTIPLWYSLVISFLVCHLAREPILSTDIIQWTIEGKLPYYAAFVEIDKQIGTLTRTCPLSSRCMFRPIHAITVQKMESLAASLANSIRLELPPVNFYAIASRYLRQLSLPVETILPHAYRIYEWSMPSELWLSAKEFRLPTRSFVLSILIVSIRILYNIHGFGKWEMSVAGKEQEAESDCNMDVNSDSLSNNREPCTSSQSSGVSFTEPYNKLSNLDATDILHVRHSKYNKLIETSEHGKDLEKYLEYCKDVVFADVELSFEEYDEEDKLIKEIRDFYQKKQEEHKPFDRLFLSPSCSPHKRPLDSSKIKANKIKKPKTGNVFKGSHKERAIQQMISNMEENRFCHIPPRSRVKRLDYLHYTRKKGDGIYVYAAHADYYILLRSCAIVAQLDVRTMHAAVLTFERRLDWLEKNIDHCLKDAPSYKACELCHDDEMIENASNDDMI
nr:TATA box-binding protein-associated factor RNA polymerase I subunit B [Tanacetum cinerariifolium]